MTTNSRLLWRYTIGILGLRADDIWLTSFPRAGNTWIRFLLCNLIGLSELDGREVDFHFLDGAMPALGYSNLLKPWPFKTIPRFVKTHQPYRQLLFTRPGKAVYILRDPRDVMVSYYHFLQAHRLRQFKGSFAKFIRHPRYGLRACVNHYLSWLPHITLIVRYEDLRQDTVAQFQKLTTALQIPMQTDLLQLAVERSSFQKMRSVEKEKGIPNPERVSSKFRAVRKGRSNGWLDYFSDKDLIFYERLCLEYGFDLYT